VDSLPLEYEIDIEHAHNLTVENRMQLNALLADCWVDANRKVARLSGDKVGRLIYLYFIGNKINTLESISPTAEKSLKDKFGDFKETYEKNPEEDNKTPEEKEKAENEFAKAWKELAGYSFDEDQKPEDENHIPGFKKGTRLRVSIGDSEVPPLEQGGRSWVQMELLDTTSKPDKFQVKLSGGELKAGDFEGKTLWIDKTPEKLEHFKTKSGNAFLKLPDPNASNSPLEHLKKVQASKIPEEKKLKAAFDTVGRNGKQLTGKFFNAEKGSSEEEPLEYFGYQDTEYDDTGAEHKQNIMFKVTHNPNKKTFKVEGSFVKHETEIGKDGKEKIVPKRYNFGDDGREMDYNSFMLFVSEKGLKPRRTAEAKALKDQQDKKDISMVNAKKRKRNWFSAKTISQGVKGIWKKINDGIDQYNKDQVDKFNDWMVEDLGIYDIVAKTLGFIPSVKEAAAGLQMEHYLERDNKIRKKIDFWLGKFRADPDF
jgi:hypothetical protein